MLHHHFTCRVLSLLLTLAAESSARSQSNSISLQKLKEIGPVSIESLINPSRRAITQDTTKPNIPEAHQKSTGQAAGADPELNEGSKGLDRFSKRTGDPKSDLIQKKKSIPLATLLQKKTTVYEILHRKKVHKSNSISQHHEKHLESELSQTLIDKEVHKDDLAPVTALAAIQEKTDMTEPSARPPRHEPLRLDTKPTQKSKQRELIISLYDKKILTEPRVLRFSNLGEHVVVKFRNFTTGKHPKTLFSRNETLIRWQKSEKKLTSITEGRSELFVHHRQTLGIIPVIVDTKRKNSSKGKAYTKAYKRSYQWMRYLTLRREGSMH